MNTEKSSVRWPLVGLLTAGAASLCCIAPVLALLSGVSGAVSSLSWLEAWRPYLIGVSVVLLGWAWYQQLKPRKVSADCGCEPEKRSFWQGRRFLLMVTVLAGVLMTFPVYAHIFYRNGGNKNNVALVEDHRAEVALHIRGMGCADCEGPINSRLARVQGVLAYNTSFLTGSSKVVFDNSQTTVAKIVSAVEETGYKVTDYTMGSPGVAGSDTATVSIYKVELVCNADPAIGCGSRAKPVLLALEKNPAVTGAWLNRQGTMIAVAWRDRDETGNVAEPVLRENSVSFVRLSDGEVTRYRGELGWGDLWYRGAEVDALSNEEAVTIASSVVRYALDSKLITPEEAAKIRTDMEVYFRGELVKIRTVTQLNEDSQGKFKQAMYSIGEKYIGKQRTMEVMRLYQEHCRKQCTNSTYAVPGMTMDCCKKS
ncbi:MAG TPA: mercuric transport protein MerTP [Puia sp.]|nr:mercuric transport protein MerTP [Puia sp.]